MFCITADSLTLQLEEFIFSSIFDPFFLEFEPLFASNLPRMVGSGDSTHCRNFRRPSSSGNAFTTSIALTMPIPLHQHATQKDLVKFIDAEPIYNTTEILLQRNTRKERHLLNILLLQVGQRKVRYRCLATSHAKGFGSLITSQKYTLEQGKCCYTLHLQYNHSQEVEPCVLIFLWSIQAPFQYPESIIKKIMYTKFLPQKFIHSYCI